MKLLLLFVAVPGTLIADSSRDEENDLVQVRGRVLDPDGKPIPEAEVSLFNSENPLGNFVKCDSEGYFLAEFSKSAAMETWPQLAWNTVRLVARASGYAPSWSRITPAETGAELTLRLDQDDVPIQGRILSLDGRPVVGARLKVSIVSVPFDGSLNGFLNVFGNRPTYNTWVRHRNEQMVSISPRALNIGEQIETDDQGRFELNGLGSERLVWCEVRGPDIETSTFLVMTRQQVAPVRPPSRAAIDDAAADQLPLYSATFNHFAGPSRPMTGTVKAKGSGEPILGAKLSVYHSSTFHRAETDADGHYSLEGLPVEGSFWIDVVPATGSPYLPIVRSTVVRATLNKLQTDFEMTCGVLVKGKLVNSQTAEAVRGYVEYLAHPDNRYYRNLSSGFHRHHTVTKDDGQFELVVLPGPGALAAVAQRMGEYLLAEDDRFGLPASDDGTIATANRGVVGTTFFNHVVPIDPAENDAPLTRKITLRPAQSVTLNLFDEDGRPLVDGVRYSAFSNFAMAPVRGGTFHVPSLRADEIRTVIFVNRLLSLGAGVVVSGRKPGTKTVRLTPCGTLSGRLVDEQNRPLTDALVFVWVDPQMPLSYSAVRTDVDGRFRMTDLVPGVKSTLWHQAKAGKRFALATLSLRSGEQRDLGDLQASKAPAQ